MSVEDVLKQHTEHDRESFDRLDKRLEKVEELLTEVVERQQKQVGFFAGVAAVVSLLLGAIGLAFQWFSK